VELIPVGMNDADETERAIAIFARGSSAGMIVVAGALAFAHRELITSLAVKHKLPAIYFDRSFVAAGGLISYGPDPIDPNRRAASYVDRILKGEKASDLPVQVPTKFQIVINQRTANALGITVPQSVLTRADEVIE